MVKILVIDNGGQWTHREWRVLRDIGVEIGILPNTTPLEELLSKNADGLVLSGGAPRVGLKDSLGNCGEYLKNLDIPILGICAGHQFMARFFGGKVEPSKIPEFGKIEIKIDKTDAPIFENLPDAFIVWESHNDEVTVLPKDFINLAHSENCNIQAMMHKNKPFYGLQFHPEVEHTEYGVDIFKNFVKICKK